MFGHLVGLVLVCHDGGLVHTTQVSHCVDMSFLVHPLPWRCHSIVGQESRRKISSSLYLKINCHYIANCMSFCMYLLFSRGDGQTSGLGLDLVHCKPCMSLLFSEGGGLD